MGHVLYLIGDNAGSYRRYRESLDVFREAGDKRGIAYCAEGLGKLALRARDWECAAQLMAFAERVRESTLILLSQPEREENEADLAVVRSSLEASAFTMCWTRGRAMTLEQAVACALEPESSSSITR